MLKRFHFFFKRQHFHFRKESGSGELPPFTGIVWKPETGSNYKLELGEGSSNKFAATYKAAICVARTRRGTHWKHCHFGEAHCRFLCKEGMECSSALISPKFGIKSL